MVEIATQFIQKANSGKVFEKGELSGDDWVL